VVVDGRFLQRDQERGRERKREARVKKIKTKRGTCEGVRNKTTERGRGEV